ncbi:hypothetical protein GW17_00014177 [Ensete ventricosum]|nr:hypothetical protein GW17_00014177 [Ensete ventricosum]
MAETGDVFAFVSIKMTWPKRESLIGNSELGRKVIPLLVGSPSYTSSNPTKESQHPNPIIPGSASAVRIRHTWNLRLRDQHRRPVSVPEHRDAEHVGRRRRCFRLPSGERVAWRARRSRCRRFRRRAREEAGHQQEGDDDENLGHPCCGHRGAWSNATGEDDPRSHLEVAAVAYYREAAPVVRLRTRSLSLWRFLLLPLPACLTWQATQY